MNKAVVSSSLLFAFLFSGQTIVSQTQFLMGTTVEIKASVPNNKEEIQKARSAMNEAFDEMERIEDIFSVFKGTSEISKWNVSKGGEHLKLSDEASRLIGRAQAYTKRTKGAFDIRVKTVADLWRRYLKEGKIPPAPEIKEAVKNESAMDFGGIATGYGVDRAVRVLKENGIANAVVNAGGDIYCLGRKSKKEKWRVAIQHPRDKNKVIFELAVENKSVNTSGDYEKFYIVDGKRYSHIIDPRTGYSVGDEVISATVIADDTVTSDAYATALCVLGEEGLRILDTNKDADALIILNRSGNFEVKTTKGFREKYVIA